MIIGYPRSPGLTNPELIREIVRAERASPCSPPPIHHELLRFRERLRRLSASFSSNLPRAARQRPQFRVIDHRERHVIDDHASHQRMIVLPAALAHRGSSNSFAPPSIYGPRPRARVEVQARFGTRLQSYIRPAYRASDEALGLDGFPRASFHYQSGDLAGHAWRQSLEAPVRPVHHQRHTTHPTQPRQERFSSAHISLCAHAVLRSALS